MHKLLPTNISINKKVHLIPFSLFTSLRSVHFAPYKYRMKYLDADKMRGKSIWNIWTPIKWEEKLQNPNTRSPLQICYSAMLGTQLNILKILLTFDCISISHFDKISSKCTNPYFSQATNPDCVKFSFGASQSQYKITNYFTEP